MHHVDDRASRTCASEPGGREGLDEVEVRTGLERDRTFRAAQLDQLGLDVEEARGAGDEQRRRMAMMLAAAAETALREIEAALDRLDRGTYGICESCGESVGADRLEVLPASRFCTPCQLVSETSSATARTRPLPGARQLSPAAKRPAEVQPGAADRGAR